MAKKQTPELHTSAIDPHAGKGGSYTLDPTTLERTLNERTQGGGISRKAPLKDEAGNEVPADETPAPDAPAA